MIELRWVTKERETDLLAWRPEGKPSVNPGFETYKVLQYRTKLHSSEGELPWVDVPDDGLVE